MAGVDPGTQASMRPDEALAEAWVAGPRPAVTAAQIVTRPPPPKRRNWGAIAGQAVAALLVLALIGWAAHNASGALARRNISVDFSFLLHPAGFDIPFHLAPWQTSDSYGYALFVAGLNTLLASGLAIVLASVLGLVVALLR